MADLIDRKAALHPLVTMVSNGIDWIPAFHIRDLPSAQQWILCSERMPEAMEEVLVTSKRGYVYTSRIVHGQFEYGGEVVAWMPLPDPYKG